MSAESAATVRIRLRTGYCWLDEQHGVVRVEHEAGTVVTLADAKEQIAAIRRASGGRRFPLLVDMRRLKFTDQEARDYFGGPESIASWCASALLVESSTSSAVGTMWVAVHGKLEAPSKVFSAESDAIRWLHEVSSPKS